MHAYTNRAMNGNTPRRIALVVPDLVDSAGVPAAAWFLYNVIQASGRYEADFISLSTSSRDEASVRVLAPASWRRGVKVETGVWRGVGYRHVGAVGGEFEFQRYMPRRQLTEILNAYDIVQVVSGAPAWALVTRDVAPPVVLQVATLVKVERTRLLREGRGPRAMWARAMTAITARLESTALRHLDIAVVINSWMLAELSARMGEARVRYAPPGVDTEMFHPSAAPSAGYILSVGRFSDPRKNARLLFHAYARLRRDHPSAPPLILAGRNMPTAADWAVAVELGIEEHVERRPDVSLAELAELYRSAGQFVSSSDEEGLGIAILEAMASGVPVVSTRSGGPDDFVADGQTGFLVPVGDEAALAARMGDLLADPRRAREMGTRGREVVMERYSLQVTGDAFLRIYDSL